MNRFLPHTLTTAAVAALVLAGGPATAAHGHGQAHNRSPKPPAVAKAALLVGIQKADKFLAVHDAAPADAKGLKLFTAKAPKYVSVTFRGVDDEDEPGYCASTSAPGMGGKSWVYDSWLDKTWRTTLAQAEKSDGACAEAADQPANPAEKAELKKAEDDAWTVVDTIDDYYAQDDVESLPSTVDAAWLASQGTTLQPGSTVTGYEVYDPEDDDYRFCLVRDSGAWATYDDDEGDIVDSGTSGQECTY